MRFLVILGRAGYSQLLASIAERLRRRGIVIDVLYSYKLRKRISDFDADRGVLEALRGADAVMLSLCSSAIGELVGASARYVIPLIAPAFKFAKVPPSINLELVVKYWENPTPRNLENLFLYVYNALGGGAAYEEPEVFPDVGFVDIESLGVLDRPPETRRDKPVLLALIYYPSVWEEVRILKVLGRMVGAEVVIGYARFGLHARILSALEELRPDVILDFTYKGAPSFPDEAVSAYRRLNAVVLRPVIMHADDIETWQQSQRGLNFFDLMFQVVMPEIEGAAEPIVVGGIGRLSSETFAEGVMGVLPVGERVQRLAGRVSKWISLRRKPNSEKKIAVIIYNYPPGEHNVGRASYLDVAASLKAILSALAESGYHVGDVPEDVVKRLLDACAVNSPAYCARAGGERLPVDEYLKFYRTLPESVRRAVEERWGPPPGSIMVDDAGFVIPGVVLGNVFIGVQPARGWHEDPAKVYHSRDLPPHHQYIAFYYWVAHVFRADAVIHLGTHGTLEFMPGKEVGLSGSCFPDMLIGNLPNIYIYNVAATPGEAMVAKRRSYAVLISHATPPVTTSGLYEEYAELEKLIEEYEEAKLYGQTARADALREEVLRRARVLHIDGSDVDGVRAELTKLKRSLMPKGLHIFGRRWSLEEVVEYLTYVLRYDRHVPSLHRLLAEAAGLNYEELLRRGSPLLDRIESEVRELVRLRLLGKSGELEARLERLPESARQLARAALDYASKVADRIASSDEIGGLLNALSGGYANVGPSDDPVLNPEVFPTGRNLHAFDPRSFPSEFAMRRAGEAARQLLDAYLRQHGRYPEKVAVDIWAAETIRTKGEPVALVLHLLGVELKRKSAWDVELVPVPLDKLGRPRVDVVVTISGVFRDLFPNLIVLIDRAVRLVAQLDEPPEVNYVRKHRMEAGDLPSVFGPPPGNYGVQIAPLIETSAWASRDDLARAYLSNMAYAYGEDVHGAEARDALVRHLRGVEVVAKIRDTWQFELMDTDDFYQYVGGLASAVEAVSGKKPSILWVDATRELLEVVDNRVAIKRGVVARLLNPRWIEEMLKHGYSGALQIAERVDHLFGLQATTGDVEEWVWHELLRRYLTGSVKERIKQHNPWALKHIADRLYEAYQRGYWKPDESELEVLYAVASEAELLIER